MNFPNKENICAILTSYNPDSDFAGRIKLISSQVGRTVIIDNNSDDQSKKIFEKISYLQNVQIIYNTLNNGVAAALNQGIHIAKAFGFEWVFLFDQDSKVHENYYETISSNCQHIKENIKIGIIGTGYSDNENHYSSQYSGEFIKETGFVITSGSLLSIAVYDIAGPFCEDFFIDYVDIEYCLRLRSKGYKIYIVDIELMFHPIGALSIHKFLWKKVGTSNHPPLRRYYMMRNHFFVLKKYLLVFPAWALGSVIERFNTLIKIVLYEKNKTQKLKYSILGVYDGLLGKHDRKLI